MPGNHHSKIAVFLQTVLLLSVVSASAVSSALAGTFDKISSEVRQPSTGPAPAPPRKKKSSQHDHAHGAYYDDYCEDDDDAVESFFGKVFFAGLTSPFWAPHAALDDDISQAGYFPEHPYENAEGGLLLDKTPRGAHDSLIVLQGQYGDNFDDIFHANGRVLMEHSSRFGFDTEFFYRNEDVPTGHDELWTGDFNITYRFAQSEKWQFRAGLGANWLVYNGESDEGINFTYGADWFPADPVVVSALLDWGRVGDAGLFHGRTTIGISHNGWGVFTGYDFFEIGHQEIHSWINGIELRF